MELLTQIVDLFLHLDKHLNLIISQYGTWTYFILFLVIFVETGVVVMPFLPGDSLLFVAGALAANPSNGLNVVLLIALLCVAAFLGDTLNYIVGNTIGLRVFEKNYRFLKKEYLLKTQAFYEKHGGKTIIFARFIPIIRTFAPFIAGVGTMKYSRFISYNVIGGFVLVVAFTVIFGNLPLVKKYFTLIIFGVIFLSLMPPLVEIVKQKLNKKPVSI
jgi:membrane-associated protein